MATQYAVFIGGYAVATAESVVELASAYQDVYADWKAADTDTRCPVIRRVTDEDRQAVTRVVAHGSLEEQVNAVFDVLQATLLGTVVIDVTSNHIKNWVLGTWKAKSRTAYELMSAYEEAYARGVRVQIA